MHHRLLRRALLTLAALAPVAATVSLGSASRAATGPPNLRSPIKHIVVIYQENHSFNDLLGRLCVDEGSRCTGSTSGTVSNGSTIPLGPEPDVPPEVGHLHDDQIAAM